MEGQPQVLFRCSLSNIEPLSYMLTCVLLEKKDQVGTISVSESGLQVTVERSKTFQAKAYIRSTSFDMFELSREYVDMEVEMATNLSILVNCLSIFGHQAIPSSKLDMSFCGESSPLALTIENTDKVVTTCQVQTLEGADLTDFNFRGTRIVNRAILKSSMLKEALQDLESRGANELTLVMSPDAPHFSLQVAGDSSTCDVRISSDLFSVFECSELRSCKFDLTSFRSCFVALGKSEHVNLRLNDQNMLSLQFIVRPANKPNVQNWIEFLLCPLEDFEE